MAKDYVSRTLETFFRKADRQFPVLLVTGARQVGKTTFVQHVRTEERTYVTLDDPTARALAKSDPPLFLQRFRPPVLIDEFQYAPELLPHIKMAVDRERKAGLFWLTGSQQFHAMKGVSESLAGRVGIVYLMGLSRRELTGDAQSHHPFIPDPGSVSLRLLSGRRRSLEEIYCAIWRGSFPAIATEASMDRDLFYGSYVQTYLQRDVRDLAQVGNEMAFLRFLRTAAARTAQILNLADLARDADVAPNTAKAWLSILQTSGIVYLLEPWHSNLTKRLVKTAKLYFVDTGLCAYLTEWSSPQTLEAGAMSGSILETWVVAEILKSFLHNGRKAPLYFYRDKDKLEIDLLIFQDGTLHPLEIKKTGSPSKHDIRHFSALKKLSLPIGSGGLICLAEQDLPMADSVHCIPADAL
jgi:predicted AAA+ superfamily ATPase